MKVDLGRDPLFQHQQSPVKQLKEQQRQRQKQLRIARMYPTIQKSNLNIQIIDPLPEQLQKYKNQIEYKKNFQSSKASQKLKKYIIEQQRNLKCIRLEKVDFGESVESSRAKKSQLKVDISSRLYSKEKQQRPREINIPKIQQIFKNQQKQFVLYQSRMMRNQLTKAINIIDQGVDNLKAYTFSGMQSNNDTKRNTLTDKFSNNISLNNSNIATNTSAFHSLNKNNNAAANQQDVQIDKIIEKKLLMSKKLRDKLYRQKKQMTSHQTKESSQRKSLNFFINIKEKPKKKVMLQGVKSITFCEGDRKLQITPASSLLFCLNKMSNGRDKKQIQLQGLIQNSYQNRDSILSQKSTFYQQKYNLQNKVEFSTAQKKKPFTDFSPSKQFKLRQLMDKKLMHRLQLSKEQINKFVSYLTQIKQYHVILNDTILEILKQVRLVLLSGKVMKTSDLAQIIEMKPKDQLMGHPNQLIVNKLFDMMI